MIPDPRRLSGRLLYCLISVLLACALTRAQAPATTAINDVIYRADGSPAAGTLVISWPAFTSAQGKAVAAGSLTLDIGAGGAVSIALVPNFGATPEGTYYRVLYKLEGLPPAEEYWSVPAASPTTIAAVRSKLVPAAVAVQTVSRQYVDSAVAAAAVGVVHTTGDETIAGVKTFTDSPHMPTPAAPEDAANKAYVDAGGGSGNATSIQGVPVSATAPTRGQGLVFDSGLYVPRSPALLDVRAYSGADLGDQILAALADCPAAGCTLQLPGGSFTVPTGKILVDTNLKKNVTLRGVGNGWHGNLGGTTLTFTGSGYGIRVSATYNASVAANFRLERLSLITTDAATAAGGLEVLGGNTFVYVDGISVNGFKYGIILDQCELCYVENSQIAAGNVADAAGVWIVNGPDLHPGALTGVTNVLAFRNNQFNGYGVQVRDDGGSMHTFDANNYHGGSNCMWFSGTSMATVSNSDCEATSSHSYVVSYNKPTGEAHGTNTAITFGPGNSLSHALGMYAVKCSNGTNINIFGNAFGSPTPGVDGGGGGCSGRMWGNTNNAATALAQIDNEDPFWIVEGNGATNADMYLYGPTNRLGLPNLLPDSTGKTLGDATRRWDIYARNIYVDNATPGVVQTREVQLPASYTAPMYLGTKGAADLYVYTNNVNRWFFDGNTGNLRTFADGGANIGLVNTARPDHVYARSSVNVGNGASYLNSSKVAGPQLEATAATGAAPLVVTSTTPVANLTLAADTQLPAITSAGKVASSALPDPTATEGGKVKARTCAAGEHVSAIGADAGVTCTPDSGGGVGYTLLLMGSQAAPAAGTTYYCGAMFLSGSCSTTATEWRILVPRTGTIKRITAHTYVNGTVPSTVTSYGSLHVRVNNTTDVTVSSAIDLTSVRWHNWDSGTLSQAVSPGDLINLKYTEGAWNVTPGGVNFHLTVYIE